MKKKIYSLLIALLFVSGIEATAQAYNTHDLSRLKTFMEQTANGKRNIDKLVSDAPQTLEADGSNWVAKLSNYVTWSGDRLSRIEAKGKGLNGALNMADCTGLSFIYLGENSLTEVNFKGCGNLAQVFLCINQIATINIEDCLNIQEFTASSNQYTTLDMGNRKKLFRLYIPNNKSLTSVNVQGCSALKSLTFTKGKVAALDLTGCGSLKTLECYGNLISSLDLSKTPVLESLVLSKTDGSGSYTNPIASLNISGCKNLTSYDFSAYASLKELNFSNCGLTTIDLSKYKGLTSIDAGNQQMEVSTQNATEGQVKVNILGYKGITVTPSDNGKEENGVITWSNVPSGKGKYSYDFTSTLPQGLTGTPFSGTVSVPWYNSSPVANMEISKASHKIYAADGILYIQPETAQSIRVYNLSGQVVKQYSPAADVSLVLSKGIYIVQLGDNTIQKVIVR